MSINRFLIFIMFVVYIIQFVFGKRKINILSIDLAICAFVFLIAINHVSIGWLGNTILLIIIPFLIGRFFMDEVSPKFIRTTIIISGLFQAMIVLFSSFIRPIRIEIEGFRQIENSSNGLANALLDGRASGSIGHPVVLGALLLICFISCFYNILRQENLFLSTAAAIIVGTSLTLTYSRGSWLAAAIVLTLMVILIKSKKALFKWVTVVLSVFIFLFSPVGSDVVGRFSGTSSQDFSVSHRTEMFSWTWENINKSSYHFIFGNGFGGSLELLQKNTPKDGFPVIDNVILSSVVDFGFIGVITLFIIILFSVIRNFNNKNSWIHYVVIAILLNGFTFDIFYWEQISIISFLLLGFSYHKVSYVSKQTSYKEVNV